MNSWARDEKLMLADGLLWTAGGGTTDDHLGHDPHEACLQPVLAGLLEQAQSRVFVDVGAHVGRWTLRLAEQASHVYAVEANPATAAVLYRNVTLNRLEGKVTVVIGAAWDCEATLRLEDPNRKERGGSTRVLEDESAVVRSDNSATRAFALDDTVIGELPAAGLVKLDVEGADLHALRGMRGFLDRCRPVMFIERHDQYGYYPAEDFDALIAGLGYSQEPSPVKYQDETHVVCRPV